MGVLHAAQTEPVHTDTEGDTYQVKLTGPGTATVVYVDTGGGHGPIGTITLAGTTERSALTIAVSRGGHTSVQSITGVGALGALRAPAVDVLGAGITLDKGAGLIQVSAVADAATFSSPANPRLPRLVFTAAQIGTGVSLTAPGQTVTLSTTKVAGLTFRAKNVALIRTTAGGYAGDIFVSNRLVALSLTGGDFSGRIQAASIGTVRVARNRANPPVGGAITDSTIAAATTITAVSIDGALTNSKIFAGAKLGADGLVGGTGENGDFFDRGKIGSVRIGGAVTSSLLGAGFTPFDGVFGNGNDGVYGGAYSTIGRLTIVGSIDPGTRIGAGGVGAVTFGRTRINPRTDPQMHFVLTRLARGLIAPNPATVAKLVDPTVASNFSDATNFLFKGTTALQTGVAPNAIKPVRAAVVRGRVNNRAGSPIAGAEITVAGHPELGTTHTQADGAFDMAVNGGGALDFQFASDGFLTVLRRVNVTTQEFTMLEPVALTTADPAVTAVAFGAGATELQTHEATMANDASGPRRGMLMFSPGTTAMVVGDDGSQTPMSSLHVRATELTLGADGPNAMPGTLPPNSGYTYCIDFTADEATATGATSVEFNQPVWFYVNNFLHFDIGIDVPSGFFNRATGQWEAGPSGRIIKVLSITGGAADLDVTGDGNADTGAPLTALGITDAERMRLAVSYTAGQSLWRVPIPHFSSWDCNWPFGPPPDAVPPGLPPGGPHPPSPVIPSYDPPCCGGSIIEPQEQVLGERIPLTGTSFSLNYRSNRVPGYKAANTVRIGLSGSAVPASLVRIELTVTVAGRTFNSQFPPQINQATTFSWDGLDAYGRELQGRQKAKVTIGYVYAGVYQQTSRFGYNGNGIPISGDRTRQEVTLSTSNEVFVGGFDIRRLSIGGWTLDGHHVYDPQSRTLYLGDGTTRVEGSVNAIVSTVVGSGQPYTTGFNNDNIPAKTARLLRPAFSTTGPDGSLYYTDANLCQVFRVGPDGIQHVIAGTAQMGGYNGDERTALSALLSAPFGIAVAPDGTVYFNDGGNRRTRSITPDGMIHTVAGKGTDGFSGDGGPATDAETGLCVNLMRATDGSLYISDANKQAIRRVGPDGIITTVAGVGNSTGFSGDNGPATAARLNAPLGTALDAEGNLYIADFNNHRIRRVGADGIIRTIAGDGNNPGSPTDPAGDGGPATLAQLGLANGLRVDQLGNIFFADGGVRRVRKITRDGLIVSVAGSGNAPATPTAPNGDGSAALQALFSGPTDVEVANDGQLYLADESNLVIRRVAPPLPGFDGSDLAIPSLDGSQLYRFSATGRHLATLHAFTGATLFTFAYDTDGQLVKITDGDGLVTRIDRAAGGAPLAIVAPFGQRTVLAADAGGSLALVRDPRGDAYTLTHDNRGLLLAGSDPEGNVHTFTYDANGRLTKDDGPGPGVSELERVELPNGGHYVTLTSALGVVEKYQTEPLPNGDELRTFTAGTGLISTDRLGSNAVRVFSELEGDIVTVQQGPNARFGLQAPIESVRTVQTPGGKLLTIETTQTATLSDPKNPLSLTAFAETVTINGKAFTISFDPATDTFLSSSPLGVQASRKLDEAGRWLEKQYAGFNLASTVYTAQGLPMTVTTGTGAEARVQRFTYNAAGLLSKYTDALNHVDTFTYDAAGRVSRRLRADGGTVAFDHDAAGKLTAFTPPGRAAHALGYSPAGDLTSYTPPGAAATTFTYNADRSPALITRGDGATVAFSYDAAGRPGTRTIAADVTTFAYDPITGNLASATTSGGQAVTFGYDGVRRTSLTWTGPVSGSVTRTLDNNLRTAIESVNGANPVTYTYDDDGSLISANGLSLTRSPVHGAVTSSTLGGVTDTRTFDNFGAASGITALFNGAPLLSLTYTFDKLGRVSHRVETIGAGAAANVDFTYDLAGRLTGVTGAATQSFAYDPNGNRTSGGATYNAQDQLTALGAVTFTYSANGDLASRVDAAGTTIYTYDALGNLTAVARPSLPLIEYLYDGQSRRIGRKSGGTLGQGFLYDERQRIAAELDGSNALVSRFVYGDGRIVPAYMIKGGATYRIVADPLGSVRLVVNTADGSLAQRIDYDAFGVVTADTAPGFQPFGFAGGHYDPETKLTHFGERDYDAAAGRWTTRDPLLIGGGDPNLYAYAGNDPVNVTDVTGLDATQDAINAINAMSNSNNIPVDPSVTALINNINRQREIAREIDRLKEEGGHKDEIKRLRQELDRLEKQELEETRRRDEEAERKRKEEEERKKRKPCKVPGK